MSKKLTKAGFTLLEILLVVAIIAVLAGIVIIAVNPARQLAQVRNTERKSDLKQINSAIQQFYIDNSFYPASTTDYVTSLVEICDTGTRPGPQEDGADPVDCTDLVDLSELVPVYVTAIPVDPQGSTLSFIPKALATTNGTGYLLGIDADNKVVLTAPQAELDAVIAIGTSTATTTATTSESTLGDDLIAHYKMNDTSGTTVNDSAGSYDATAQRDTSLMTTAGVSSETGTALNFVNASGDYLAISSMESLTDFSVATWVYINSIPTDWGPLLFLDSNQFEWVFRDQTSPPNLEFADWALTQDVWTDSTISLGSWHHVAITRESGSNVTLYIDGDAQSVTVGSGPASGSYSVGNAYIGYQSGVGRYINAVLDDYRIYSRALTVDEVAELYNDGDGTEVE